jgi:enamine deaminase RidA (YjgF/YER057c/UK114 family)
MSDTIEKRLEGLGVTLPVPAAPAANYLPFAQSGKLLLTAGQLPLKDGKLLATGLLGRDVDVATGKEAAKYCAVNILAQARAALGSLDRIARVVKITVFVASTPNSIWWRTVLPTFSLPRLETPASMPGRRSERRRCL